MQSSSISTDDPAQDLQAMIAAGRYRDALEWRKRAEVWGRTRPEVDLLTATAAVRLGDLTTGASLAAMALERFLSDGNTAGRIRSLNLLGAVAFEHGRLSDAHDCFREALELAQRIGDALLLARASNNLASVAQLRGESPTAVKLYRSALQAYQRLGDRRGLAETYHNLGITFRFTGSCFDAETAAHHAVRHAEDLGDRSLMALVIAGEAEIDLECGKPFLAARRMDRAAQYAAEAGDRLAEAEVGRLRALWALWESDYAAAALEAEAARATAESLGSGLLRAECAAVSARAFRGLGRVAEAVERCVEAVQLFQRQGATQMLEKFRAEWEQPKAK